MARFRLFLVALTGWLFILFNLARPEIILGDTDFTLNLSPAVYVMAAAIALLILLLPDLGRVRVEFVYLPVALVYLLIRLAAIGVDPWEPKRSAYLVVTELLTLFITVWLVRMVSLAVSNFEKAVENVILRPSSLRILSMADGEEKINSELFRARRFDRPVSFIMIDMMALEAAYSGQKMTVESVFQRHYLQARIGHIVETALYQTDIMTWYNENLLICLPETSYAEAMKAARELDAMLRIRLDAHLPMGVVSFPQHGLIYADLVAAAVHSMGLLTPDEQQPPAYTGGPVAKRETGVLPDLEEVNKQTLPISVSAGGLAQKPQSRDGDESVRVAHPANAEPVTGGVAAAASALAQTFSLANLRRLFDSYRHMTDLVPMPAIGPATVRKPSDRPDDPDFWVNLLPYQSTSSRAAYRVIKRVIDLALVLLAAPLVLPLGLLVALVIYLDSGGPIFFVQERTGMGGRRFRMYKFRTMAKNAEEMLKGLAARGLAKLDAKGKLAEPLKLARDPRITRVGNFLRKTSLDEIPQLINVLLGDMSIVGPRPTSWDLGSYTLLQTERLSVRPGITGLWQVYGRGSTDFNSWVQWDTLYIEKMSLTLDIQLILLTGVQVLRRHGAR